jgi:hypothetical protein
LWLVDWWAACDEARNVGSTPARAVARALVVQSKIDNLQSTSIQESKITISTIETD